MYPHLRSGMPRPYTGVDRERKRETQRAFAVSRRPSGRITYPSIVIFPTMESVKLAILALCWKPG